MVLNFVDVRLVYNMHIDQISFGKQKQEDISIEKALIEDANSLSEIAKNSYVDSRYYFDHHFDIDKCEQFYKDWIIKSVNGKFDDVVYVAKKK